MGNMKEFSELRTVNKLDIRNV